MFNGPMLYKTTLQVTSHIRITFHSNFYIRGHHTFNCKLNRLTRGHQGQAALAKCGRVTQGACIVIRLYRTILANGGQLDTVNIEASDVEANSSYQVTRWPNTVRRPPTQPPPPLVVTQRDPVDTIATRVLQSQLQSVTSLQPGGLPASSTGSASTAFETQGGMSSDTSTNGASSKPVKCNSSNTAFPLSTSSYL